MNLLGKIIGIDISRLRQLANTDDKPTKRNTRAVSKKTVRSQIAKYEVEMANLKSAILAAENTEEPNRIVLYGVYLQILEEAHLSSQIRTAHFTIKQSDFEIRKNGKADMKLKELFEQSWFTDFVDFAVESEWWGHSLIEFGDMFGGQFREVQLINRFHVVPEFQSVKAKVDDTLKNAIFYAQNMPDWFLIEIGDKYDLGLLRKAAREVIWKVYARSDWSNATEKYGMPLLSVTTDTSNEAELDELENMAKNFGSNGYIIGSKDSDIEIIQPDRGTQFYMNYERLATFCDNQISKLINGQTGTSDNQAYVGTAEVQERVLNTYTKGRLARIQRVINDKLIPFLTYHGYPLSDCKFQYLDLLPSSAMADTSDNSAQKKKSELNLNYPEGFGNPQGISSDLNELYASLQFDFNEVIEAKLSDDMQRIFDALTKKIHELAVADNLPEDAELLKLEEAKALLTKTAETYEAAMQQGMSKIDFKPDAAFVEKLRKSVWVFSGFKTNRQLLDISARLADAAGKIKPFNKFRDDVLDIHRNYNVNWLRTEYNQAVSASLTASRWNQYEQDGDRYLLQYRTAGDERVRDSHTKLNGIKLPLSDSFWDAHYPPNGWGCRCSVIQVLTSRYKPSTAQEVSDASEGIFSEKEKIFAYNPGKSIALFPPKHPYYKIQNALVIPVENEIAKIYYKNIIKKQLDVFRASINPYKGLEINSESIKTGRILLLRDSVKQIINHNLDISVRNYILNIAEDIDNWNYMGWANVSEGKHNESAYFFYYSIRINGIEKFANVKIHKHLNSEVVYAILDNIDKTTLKEGLPDDIDNYIKK